MFIKIAGLIGGITALGAIYGLSSSYSEEVPSKIESKVSEDSPKEPDTVEIKRENNVKGNIENYEALGKKQEAIRSNMQQRQNSLPGTQYFAK